MQTNLTTEMNAVQIAEAVEAMINVKRPVFIWGQPGVGKSQVVGQVADNIGYSFKDVRLSQMDPVDLRGLPTLNGDGKTHWGIPDFLPDAKRDGKQGILFLDEMNSAPQLVQAAAYQLVLDRQLGEYTLPEGWVVVAAGNREGDKGVTSRMPTPLANRFVHQGLYLPGTRSEQLPPIVVAIDTSGSVGQGDLDQFAAEIDRLLRTGPAGTDPLGPPPVGAPLFGPDEV